MALRQQVAPELLNKVTKALGITAIDQWYYVSHHTAAKLIGPLALNTHGGTVASFLKAAYPNHYFDEEKLASKKKLEKDQKFIEVVIRKLFPNVDIQTKARKAVGIIHPETNAYLEIDFWIPSLKLGIEYQDKHHYEHQWYANGTLDDYQNRDTFKKDSMSHLGYTLITIGCWWDKSIESIAATIRQFRPDLLREYNNIFAEPVSPYPPPGFFSEASVIPGVEGLMSPFIPRDKFDPTNWYAGEKYDGIRGVYNPVLNKLFSRAGNDLTLIPALLDGIPKLLLEGEITMGRGNYNKTAAVSYHSYHDKVNWAMFRYIIFDVPDGEAGDYSLRYSGITKEFVNHHFIFAQLASRVLILNKAHLKEFVDVILGDAGEGVIVQKDAQYEYGRAKSLAKIKVRRDSDAKILWVNERSCTCKLVSGINVDINFSDDFDPSDLNVGDIVSFYHNGFFPSGKPKRGEIYKVRYDIPWETLASEAPHKVTKRRSVKEAIGSRSLLARKTARNKMGHWNKPANVRAFFDAFATTHGFDPLVPENWHQVRYSTLRNAGGGLLYAYGFNVKKALSVAYPDLKVEEAKLKPNGKNKIGHWNNPANVRSFLEAFARKYGFDPMVPENWYNVRIREVQEAGGGLLKYYSLNKALTFAFPELKFEMENFRVDRAKVPLGYWNKSPNVRAFFDKFATTSGFDPLEPQNWLMVTHSSLRNAGGGGLLSNLVKSLSLAYPELQFDTRRSRSSSKAIS